MKKRRFIGLMLAVSMIVGVFSLSTLAVSANEVKPFMVLDYVKETVWIDYDSQGRTLPGDLTINENVVLLYALKIKSDDDKDLEKAKWLPTYSGAINISKYIPKKSGSNPYKIAFRWSDQAPKKENVAIVELKARQAITKGDVLYDTENQQIIAKGKGFEVKIGDDVWYENETDSEWGIPIGDDNPLSLPMKFLPTGGVATARKAPVFAEPGSAEGQFASTELKIKLPKPPKAVAASKIAIVSKSGKSGAAYIKGVSEKMEVFVGETQDNKEEWKTLKKNMTVAEFDKLFEGETSSGKVSHGDKYSFRIRNKASGTKKPASPETVIEFEQKVYEEAVTAGNAE